jgi:hypothetical protein
MRLHQQEWLWQHALADACWLQVLHFTVTLSQKVLAHHQHRTQHHSTLSMHSWHATSLGGQPTLLLRRAVEAVGCAQPPDAVEILGFVSMESQSTDEACTATGPVGVACTGATFRPATSTKGNRIYKAQSMRLGRNMHAKTA